MFEIDFLRPKSGKKWKREELGEKNVFLKKWNHLFQYFLSFSIFEWLLMLAISSTESCLFMMLTV